MRSHAAVAPRALADLTHLTGSRQPGQAVAHCACRAPQAVRDRRHGQRRVLSPRVTDSRTSPSGSPERNRAGDCSPRVPSDQRSGSRRPPSRPSGLLCTVPPRPSAASVLPTVDRPRPVADAISALVSLPCDARALTMASPLVGLVEVIVRPPLHRLATRAGRGSRRRSQTPRGHAGRTPHPASDARHRRRRPRRAPVQPRERPDELVGRDGQYVMPATIALARRPSESESPRIPSNRRLSPRFQALVPETERDHQRSRRSPKRRNPRACRGLEPSGARGDSNPRPPGCDPPLWARNRAEKYPICRVFICCPAGVSRVDSCR
jgi:hypothetical protein